MATIIKAIADRIIAGKYSEDAPSRIVEYTNAWGKLFYGVTFGQQDKDTYLRETGFVRNPKIYWDKK